MIFLIDKPFVSDFLIETLKDSNCKVVSTTEAKELIPDDSLNWISEETAVSIIKNDPDTPLYLNSENAITWLVNNIGPSVILNHILQFKDKSRFRELMKFSFPGFSYRTIPLEEIQNLSYDELNCPFVIKPAVGFFSLGVHIVHNISEWDNAKKELNLKTLQNIYPAEVIDTATFIIEEYIEGDEYAVDCYFNNKGAAVILNILHHRFSSGTDISDRVYTTSKDIILKYKNDIENFLMPIGKRCGLRNFPAHVELRINSNGSISPIEVNPLRFGGWCTTGDLSWYAYGINSYECFINNMEPDWDFIFKNRKNKKYSIVVLNNSSGYTSSEITRFDYELLEKDFENALIIRKLDIKKDPVFGFVFTETSLENEEELTNILVSDLRKYIITE